MQINDEHNYRCAGVILIHANNSFQDAYILLGQSSNQNNPCWGGFGGQLQPDELWEDAAAREFYEETLACIDPFDATETDKLSIAERICNLSTSLKNKNYIKCIISKKDWYEARYYVVSSKMDHFCSATFNSRKCHLEDLVRQNLFVDMCYMEKRGINWVSIDILIKQFLCPRMRRFRIQSSFIGILMHTILLTIDNFMPGRSCSTIPTQFE